MPRSEPWPPDDREHIGGNDQLLLVIDDDPVFAQAILDINRRQGYKTLLAASGGDGLALARRFSPKGILLDLGLPDMDGSSVLHLLKTAPEVADIPVYIVSGRDRDNAIMDAGAIGWLHKPVDAEQIARIEAEMLASDQVGGRNLLLLSNGALTAEEIAPLLDKHGGHLLSLPVEAFSMAALSESIRAAGGCRFAILDLGETAASVAAACQVARQLHSGKPELGLLFYGGKPLGDDDEAQLRQYSDSIIIKAPQAERHLQMTERTRNSPIVFITAVFKAEEFIHRGFGIGAVDYLTKPIDDNLLLNRIRLYQSIHSRERHLAVAIAQLQLKEHALLLAKEAAEAASRAKSTFLANMSHELRTPMSGIMGMIELVLRHTTDPKQQAQLSTAKQSALHLLHVINNILDISKIEADRLQLEQLDFVLGQVLENLTNLIGQKVSDKGLKLRIRIEPGLPMRRFRGDPTRLGQILLNLVGNALKFTEQGAITLSCRLVEETPNRLVEETPDGVLLRWEVADTGIGIDAEAQKRLFSAFEQADNSMTRTYGGTGLGLTITKRLVELMGGEIGVDSQPGSGSTFWFSVRLDKPGSAAAMPAPSDTKREPETRLQEGFPGARILLAEDEPVNQEVSRGLLEDVGLRIDLAEDGAQALALAKQHRYALILMDMQMPNLNGIEATRAIRADSQKRDTPILAMTANAFDEDRQLCIEAGMNDHIAKPVEPAVLYEIILKWLANPPEDCDPRSVVGQFH